MRRRNISLPLSLTMQFFFSIDCYVSSFFSYFQIKESPRRTQFLTANISGFLFSNWNDFFSSSFRDMSQKVEIVREMINHKCDTFNLNTTLLSTNRFIIQIFSYSEYNNIEMIHEYYSTLGFGWINVGYYVFASRRVGLIVCVVAEMNWPMSAQRYIIHNKAVL